MELVCVSCGDPLDMHCYSATCNWLRCRDCQVIVSRLGAIPTWERYIAEGRNEQQR